ncbi:uncharacterized protein K460DRAFT_352277 [Cucurbitaria berberidis CBS 394.84]|uniref:Uncharacterized protein n=1 Tax=Cucurbitaria berberidis CBS 394.84 TaxID=1168544 RepID=A0A9P4GKH4_9PLEO|nr:uncharacterized protein K460DRAFT_352277 [Cucurbitaria berberidis CBS 394.84]KAF1847094.1 hypothetical protein K460DRAFT_352277 [Cucurbitaria berberidis CBS 394.84]
MWRPGIQLNEVFYCWGYFTILGQADTGGVSWENIVHFLLLLNLLVSIHIVSNFSPPQPTSTMSQWTIGSLSLQNPQLYPAVDDRGCATDFAFYRKTLWDKSKGPRILVINALTEKKITLHICIDGKESAEDFKSTHHAVSNDSGDPTLQELQDQRKRGFIFKAYAERRNGSWEEVGLATKLWSFNMQSEGQPYVVFELKDVDLKRVYSYRKVDEPWAFVGKLRFEMTIVSTADGKALDGTGYNGRGFHVRSYSLADQPSIEFYAICPAIPKFLRHDGIPITLLRFALGPQNKMGTWEPADYPYAKAITHRVFNSGFKYERSSGNYSFTSGAGRTTQLGKFLRIWSVLNKSAPEQTQKLFELRFKDNPPTVNCMDQTGILGLCMSFACVDEDDRNTLIAYFTKPFGFLHDSPLVGWDKDKDGKTIQCNNPLKYTSQPMPDLFYPPTTPFRSFFGSHVFLEFRNRIYDACAGPYTGGHFAEPGDLKVYLDAAVDSKPGTVPTKFWDSSEHKTVEEPPGMRPWTGTAEIAKPFQVADGHGGILGELDHTMREGNDWKRVPDDLNHELDLQAFSLDIEKLGKWIIDETKSSSTCQVTTVEDPVVDTGATVINKDAAENGSITWCLEANGSSATLYVHILSRFEDAAAERSAMFGQGRVEGGPTKTQLARDNRHH